MMCAFGIHRWTAWTAPQRGGPYDQALQNRKCKRCGVVVDRRVHWIGPTDEL